MKRHTIALFRNRSFKILGAFFTAILVFYLILLPEAKAATFDRNSANIVNRYYPLKVGAKWTYRGTGVIAGRTGSHEATAIETVDGVSCIKVVANGPDGMLYEWFAQDTAGAVWRLRQYDVGWKEYDDEDYLIMPANPKVGERYTIWFLDYEVASLSTQITVPAGSFSNCLELRSIDNAWPGERECYAPGVGEVKTADTEGGYELTSFAGVAPLKDPLMITTPVPLPTAQLGIDYAMANTASGGVLPYNWSLAAGALPGGLQLAANGVISGTPTSAGAATFSVQVVDKTGASDIKSLTLVVQAPVLKVSSIWSEQIPAFRKNLLPDHAGDRSNQSGYILMGAREDGLAYVGATIESEPSLPNADLRARIIKIAETAIQPIPTQMTRSGNTFGLIFNPSSDGSDVGASIFRVETWIEINGDGVPTDSAGESTVRSPWAFLVITKARYDFCKEGIKTEVSGMRALHWRYAPDFAQIFLDATPPSYVTRITDIEVGADNIKLSHHVGTIFSNEGTSIVKEYVFDTSTDISKSVVTSAGMHAYLARIVRDARTEIVNYFAQNPDKNTYFLYPADSNIMFDDATRDTDLVFSIHQASCHNEVITVPREPSRGVSISGTLLDLYDWDFEGAKDKLLGEFMDPMYASVQAGYGTLGDAGHVFRIRLEFNGDIASVNYGGTCHLIPRVVGLSVQVDLFGFPEETVLVEESKDLKTWTESERILLSKTGIGTLKKPLGEAMSRFFRAKTTAR